MQPNGFFNVINDLKTLSNPQKAISLQRFFKTGAGQYGEGDIFWGITVPLLRSIARKYKTLSGSSIKKMIQHNIHEVRLCALLIMVQQVETKPEQTYNLYLSKTKFINNWDLVDLSAPTIVGQFLLNKDYEILYKLARSPLLWERRIAIVATHAFIKQKRHEPTLTLAHALIQDPHDLIHKAVGWMLREVGKRCSVNKLEFFLKQHAANMPRTMLRYAIERLPKKKKQYFMIAKRKQ